MNPSEIRVACPKWVAERVDWERRYALAEERVRLAIALSRENVERGTGGPFGAAVFEMETGRLVSVGMNLVVAHHNSALHAEMVALMMAEQSVGSHTLRGTDLVHHELIASCDPCAMCLGAALWSGVSRLVCAADRVDAKVLGFDEGPVYPASYRYLEERGVDVVRGVLREEAREVFALYRDRGGVIYNG